MKPNTILRYYLVLFFLIGLNIDQAQGQHGLLDDITLSDCTPKVDSAWIDPSARFGNNQPALRTVQQPWTPTGAPTIRVAYLIPSNRSPQPNGVSGLQYVIEVARDFFKEQMTHNGLEPKTINYETESDGVTPLIHVINIPETDDMIRQIMWSNTINAAINQAVPIWENNEIWLLVPEAHLMLADGSIEGWTALGLGFGSANDPGVALLGSTTLTLLAQGMITDDRSYHGMIIPEIGPYPLQKDVTFPSVERSTLSTVLSSHLGAFLHELGHALGLDGHDGRNDRNANGNLMGSGLRGIRGYLHPELYPNDYTRLAFGNAHVLNTSHYFNSGQVRNHVDQISIGRDIIKGRLVLDVDASDEDGLSLLRLVSGGQGLIYEGNIAEKRLFGVTSFNGTLTTPYFQPGVLTDFWLQIYDQQGNRLQHQFQYTPPVANGAPLPFVRITPPIGSNEDLFTLDASQSMDPNGDTPLTYAWDFMDDGDYDPGTATMEQRFTPGNHLVRVKVTDAQGNYAFSSPIGLHVSGESSPPQFPQNIEWIRQFGTEADETVREVSAYGTDVYVCGRVGGALPGQTHFGYHDAFVRKYDVNGNQVWTRQFGTDVLKDGLEGAKGISVDASGVYVCGTVDGALPGQMSPVIHGAFVRKYDTDGNEMWTHQFGGEAEANAVSVDVTGVYLVGYTDAADVQYLRKYDVNGTEVWTHQIEFTLAFGARSSIEVAAVDVHASGVYVGGAVPGFFPGQTHQGDFDAYIAKYDFNGTEIWTRQFGTESRDQIKGIFADETGIYVTGAISGFGSFLRKYDTNGNEIWSRHLPVDRMPNNGGISGDATGVYVSGEIESDMIVFKYDFHGNEVWSQQFGTSGSDRPGGISANASGVYIGGGTDGVFPDQSNFGGNDAFIAKIKEGESYEVLDIDFCNPGEAPFYNFYWNEMKLATPGSEFFSQNEKHSLTFTEFEDGTALIEGATQSGSCSAQLYVVLKDMKNWATWVADGGKFKPQGCDPGSLDEEGLRYYVIDGDKSTVSVTGGDCLEQGTFIITQRPDPNDPNTGNLGVHVGPGGALFDSDPSAEGLAGWAWMGPKGDERKWEIDFNFHIQNGDNLENNREEVYQPSTVQKVTNTVITPYPTRFKDRLNLQIEISYGAVAQIQIFDLQWRLVMARKDVKILPGKNDLSIDVAGLAPNMYVLVLNTGREEFKRKVFAK